MATELLAQHRKFVAACVMDLRNTSATLDDVADSGHYTPADPNHPPYQLRVALTEARQQIDYAIHILNEVLMEDA